MLIGFVDGTPDDGKPIFAVRYQSILGISRECSPSRLTVCPFPMLTDPRLRSVLNTGNGAPTAFNDLQQLLL
ncbi:hypothetical protein PILCRDRAFT_819534 [Piloderma croceum F 1598]|uniref:Uncharacterized protein n=1 Tax=Piloderma croceum (strain F 1598) TaxID=765440 RepID=A0A0C3FV08_PILCF|nr:hypothetical protein PILCRDRAFT_819534 [Piloderma croceum F 1598]